jgi:hypothetical protein
VEPQDKKYCLIYFKSENLEHIFCYTAVMIYEEALKSCIFGLSRILRAFRYFFPVLETTFMYDSSRTDILWAVRSRGWEEIAARKTSSDKSLAKKRVTFLLHFAFIWWCSPHHYASHSYCSRKKKRQWQLQLRGYTKFIIRARDWIHDACGILAQTRQREGWRHSIQRDCSRDPILK